MKYVWVVVVVLAPGAFAVWLLGSVVTTVLGSLMLGAGAWAAVRWWRMNPRPPLGSWRVALFGLGASFTTCGYIGISISEQDAAIEKGRLKAAEAEPQQTTTPITASDPSARHSGETGKVESNLNIPEVVRQTEAPGASHEQMGWPIQMGWAGAEAFLQKRGYLTVAAAEEEPTTLRGNDRRCTTQEDCDSVRPEVDFDYSKQGDTGAPECITVFHIKPINWRAIISEFTGGEGSTVPKARGKSPRVRTIAGASGPVDVVIYPDETMVSMGSGCDLEGAVREPSAMALTSSDRERKGIEKREEKLRAALVGEEENRAAIDATCGGKPAQSSIDGMLLAVNRYLKDHLDDPDSYEGLGCTEPVLTKKDCWSTACEFRAANAMGAKILQAKKFYV
jgi:hypothetical protein